VPGASLAELERALQAAWSLWTADPADHYRWSAENPASGQCASTALIVYDAFGGELLESHVREVDGAPAGYHYFNPCRAAKRSTSLGQFRSGEQLHDARALPVPADRRESRMSGPSHLLAERVRRELAHGQCRRSAAGERQGGVSRRIRTRARVPQPLRGRPR
jgi:hypothetical protein